MALSLAPGKLFGASLKSRDISSFRLSERTYPPRFLTPKHSHRWPLFCFVIDGAYTETYGAKTRACRPSTLLFHPQGELHAEHFHDSGGRSFIVEIEPRWLDSMREHGAATDSPADFCGGILPVLGMRLYNEFRALDDVSPLVVEGLMLEIVAEASRRPAGPAPCRPPQWLEAAREVVRGRFTESLKLADVADEVGVHRVHLAQMFHKYFHSTLGEYVRRLRVDFACHKLATTDASLVEIALAAGFCDQSHFTRTFRRHAGLVPSQYRKCLRGRNGKTSA